MHKLLPLFIASWLGTPSQAQPVLFDFDSAPLSSPLPLDLTVGGITANLSATGQGFSIQLASTLGFTPAGFGGNCVYPSSVYSADLIISFSTPLIDFSILYAPEEYACDSSATMRVTAYQDSIWIGTATTNAVAGTWPSEILHIATSQPFNRVVVHYDQPPVTGGDWGPIFMADNMTVITAPPPIVLVGVTLLTGGFLQFSFTNTPASSFTVLSSPDLSQSPANWTVAGTATEILPGTYQFTDPQAATNSGRFYSVRSP